MSYIIEDPVILDRAVKTILVLIDKQQEDYDRRKNGKKDKPKETEERGVVETKQVVTFPDGITHTVMELLNKVCRTPWLKHPFPERYQDKDGNCLPLTRKSKTGVDILNVRGLLLGLTSYRGTEYRQSDRVPGQTAPEMLSIRVEGEESNQKWFFSRPVLVTIVKEIRDVEEDCEAESHRSPTVQLRQATEPSVMVTQETPAIPATSPLPNGHDPAGV